MRTKILMAALLMVPVATADIVSGELLHLARLAGRRLRRRLT
jgi:hypothetical protein